MYQTNLDYDFLPLFVHLSANVFLEIPLFLSFQMKAYKHDLFSSHGLLGCDTM